MTPRPFPYGITFVQFETRRLAADRALALTEARQASRRRRRRSLTSAANRGTA